MHHVCVFYCRLYRPHTLMGIDQQYIHYRGPPSQQYVGWNRSLWCSPPLPFLVKTSLSVYLFIISEITAMASHKNRHRAQTPDKYSEEQMGAPCPGDTLPWNLSKHQRIKRSKSTSGEVLDPAERAVIRIAGRTRRRVHL